MIKYIITDCDGVLTNGKYGYTEDGKYFVHYHCSDYIATRIARENGLTFVMVSSTSNPEIHKRRAKDLGIDFISARPTGSKLDVLSRMFNLDEVVYIGDTIDDIPMLEAASISFVPNDSLEEVKLYANYVLSKNGGEGCLLELVLALRDEYGFDIKY